jgi:hypothetical protein
MQALSICLLGRLPQQARHRALIFYSVGVWSERIARYLKPWHVAAFWTGLALGFGA